MKKYHSLNHVWKLLTLLNYPVRRLDSNLFQKVSNLQFFRVTTNLLTVGPFWTLLSVKMTEKMTSIKIQCRALIFIVFST